jgi:hypothetical protein
MSEEHLKQVCDTAGVLYVGLQDGPHGQIVLFNDAITGSTLAVDKKDCCNAKIQARVTVHRKKYGDAVTYLSDTFDAIKFITRKKIIPRGVLMSAAKAATDIVMKHLKEETEQLHASTEKAA